MHGYTDCKLPLSDKILRADRKFPVGTHAIEFGSVPVLIVCADRQRTFNSSEYIWYGGAAYGKTYSHGDRVFIAIERNNRITNVFPEDLTPDNT